MASRPVSSTAPIQTLKRHITTSNSKPISNSKPPQQQPRPQSPSQQSRFPKLTTPDHCLYWDTTPPTPSQTRFADHLFSASKHSPIKIWSASQFHTIPPSPVPEIAFFGRSNVGKSTVMNALMGKPGMCYTSANPGRTRELNAYGVGGTKGGEWKITLVDTPGYGKASHTEWGDTIMRYLQKRNPLRRCIILIDAKVGFKSSDLDLLTLFRHHSVPHQIVLSKADALLTLNPKKFTAYTTTNPHTTNPSSVPSPIQTLQSRLHNFKPIIQPEPGRGPGALGELISLSAEGTRKPITIPPFGISHLRWAVVRAAGLDAGTEVDSQRVT